MKIHKIISITAVDYFLYALTEDGKIYRMRIPNDDKQEWELFTESPTEGNIKK